MKLTLTQQADHIELALQSQRDHVGRVLPKRKASSEERNLARYHLGGLEAAHATMRFLAKNEGKLRKLLAEPDDAFEPIGDAATRVVDKLAEERA